MASAMALTDTQRKGVVQKSEAGRGPRWLEGGDPKVRAEPTSHAPTQYVRGRVEMNCANAAVVTARQEMKCANGAVVTARWR